MTWEQTTSEKHRPLCDGGKENSETTRVSAGKYEREIDVWLKRGGTSVPSPW
jgi:hypothetical protein